MKKIKTALVTGSSQGIGRAIAKKFAENGYRVYVTYCTNEKLGKETVKEIVEKGFDARLIKLDVRSERSVKSVFKHIKSQVSNLNVLVNNAGLLVPKNIEDISFGEWSDVVNTKISGNFLCTKYALPLMKHQQNANIIIIISGFGERPIAEDPSYCVGVSGTITFTKSMALYLGKYGIRTNAIGPGPTKTAIWKSMHSADPEMWNNFSKDNPMGRVTKPEDIANAVLMIINDESKFLNGNIIYMNGGSHLK